MAQDQTADRLNELLGPTSSPDTHLLKSSDAFINQQDGLFSEVHDKAFVSFKTYLAASIAVQSMHGGSASEVIRVHQAPEPRAVLWENFHLTSKERRTRSFMANVIVAALIATYTIPVTLLSLLLSENALISFSPTIAKLAVSSRLFSSLIASIQPVCVVILQQVRRRIHTDTSGPELGAVRHTLPRTRCP